MNIKSIEFDENTFGITETSLKMLRDTLAERYRNRIAVVEVPTSDLCCGYFIFDLDREDCIFSGDGFRTDRAGEGGAGYKSAEVLFMIFGITPIGWEVVNFDVIYGMADKEIGDFLSKIANRITSNLSHLDFKRPQDMKPQYVRR